MSGMWMVTSYSSMLCVKFWVVGASGGMEGDGLSGGEGGNEGGVGGGDKGGDKGGDEGGVDGEGGGAGDGGGEGKYTMGGSFPRAGWYGSDIVYMSA